MSFLGDSCASFHERKTKPRRRRHWRVPGQRTPGPKVTFVSGSLITITQTGRTTSATARPLAQLQPSIGSGSLQRLNEGPVPCSTQQGILQAKGEQEREIVQREGVRTGGRGSPCPLCRTAVRSCLPAYLPRGSINLLQRIVATGN